MDLTILREEIASLIEKGRASGIDSACIADEIFRKSVFDRDVIVQQNMVMEGSLNMGDIFMLARKALKQAEFDGVSVMLAPGRRISRKNSNGVHGTCN